MRLKLSSSNVKLCTRLLLTGPPAGILIQLVICWDLLVIYPATEPVSARNETKQCMINKGREGSALVMTLAFAQLLLTGPRAKRKSQIELKVYKPC
jgi:hypothetical protein